MFESCRPDCLSEMQTDRRNKYNPVPVACCDRATWIMVVRFNRLHLPICTPINHSDLGGTTRCRRSSKAFPHPQVRKRGVADGALAQRIRNRQNLSRRKVVKRNSTHQFPAMTSPLSKPKQHSNPSVQSPSMNPRPTPIQKPITTPTPELSAYQHKWFANII